MTEDPKLEHILVRDLSPYFLHTHGWDEEFTGISLSLSLTFTSTK
jgi:hypothetical protein